MRTNDEPVTAGRCNVVLGEDDNRLLIELRVLYERRLNKRLPYSTVMRIALRKLAEFEKIKTNTGSLV